MSLLTPYYDEDGIKRRLERRRVCCDAPTCPYDQRRTEYARYLLFCLWVGHKWMRMEGFQLCPRCRAWST